MITNSRMLENPTDWKVLGLFCKHPTRSFFVNETARLLKISQGSSSRVCKRLFEAGVLAPKRAGNLLLYSLDGQSFIARAAKKFWFLEKLASYRKLLENEDYQLVALYGSYSSGEYVEKSDIDLLVMTNVEEPSVLAHLRPLKSLGELSITVFPLSSWLELKGKADPFYKEVVANHTLLYGGKLVI